MEYVQILSKFMKFNIDLIQKKYSENEKVHMHKSLLLTEYEIAIVFTSSGSRHMVLPPIGLSRYRLYLTVPSIDSVSSTFFIELFHPILWTTIHCTYAIFVAFLFFYKYLHKLKFSQFLESVFHVIGFTTEQIRFSTFTLSFCVLLSSILFYLLGEHFTAFLTSKLAIISEQNLPFEKLEDLSTQSKYKLCTLPDSNVEKSLYDQHIYLHILNHDECKCLIEQSYNHNELYFTELFCRNPNITFMTMTVIGNYLEKLSRYDNNK